MARLNEAPLSTESVDALKRRFIRQNRDLAKTNSQQCLRIRALECETSRLHTENLDLCEELLRLQNELAAARSQAHVPDSILTVRQQLEAKLSDFASLVAELGTLHHVSGPQSHDSLNAKHKREPDPASWRPHVPVAALSGQAHRLSEILEEKASPGGTLRYYDPPRPTRFSDTSNESPDLGPPPVVHFESEEPISFNPHPQEDPLPQEDLVSQEEGRPSPGEPTTDADGIPPALCVNLETRRRRRDGHSKLGSSSLLPPDSHPRKTSTKRKLSLYDTEDAKPATTEDDFVFRRSSTVTEPATNEQAKPDEDEPRIADQESTEPIVRTERRVLGKKSANVAPRKAVLDNDTKKTDKSRERVVKIAAPQRPPAEVVVDTVELPPLDQDHVVDVTAPKTPAPDLFSPTPSESSGAKLGGRDTPPPSGLASVTPASATLNGASRPSRRARAAVSYAEPNLVSKMRRPSSNLADAVTMNNRRSISQPTSEHKKAARAVVIKKETTEPNWNAPSGQEQSEAASPLGRKGDDAQQSNSSTGAAMKRSASGKAIAALMAGQAAAKATNEDNRCPPTVQTQTRTEKASPRETDVYDFTSSSPAEGKTTSATAIPKARGSRRHSSIVDAGARSAAGKEVGSQAQKVPDVRAVEGGQVSVNEESVEDDYASARRSRVASRRRSMML